MMKYLKPLLVQFKALNTRERLLTIAAFLGVIYFIFDFALIRPEAAKARDLRSKIEKQETELATAAQALSALSAASAADPLAKQRAERDQMRATFAEAEALMARLSNDVRLSDVVRAMVAARPGLTLVSLRTLTPEQFYQTPAAPAPASGASAPVTTALPLVPPLYKHGIEVTVQGSYPALVAYMQQLERSGGAIFWGNVKLDVVGYPDAVLKMSVFTLSPRSEQPLG